MGALTNLFVYLVTYKSVCAGWCPKGAFCTPTMPHPCAGLPLDVNLMTFNISDAEVWINLFFWILVSWIILSLVRWGRNRSSKLKNQNVK